MTASQTRPLGSILVVLAVAVAVFGVGLGRFGIWQPSELRVADMARTANASVRPSRPPLQVALVRAGFQQLGPSELGGRLPTALLAIAAALALAHAVAAASDARAGAYVGVAYATMPLVYLNARQMFGGGVAQSGFTLFFAGGLYALYGRPPPGAQEDDDASAAPLYRYGRWALLGFFALAVAAAGWMLGVVPVLLGLGLAVLLRYRDEPVVRRIAGVGMAVAGVVIAALAVRAVLGPAGEVYNPLTGAGSDARAPGQALTYETLIEQIGHGLFPWTGIVAFGIVRLLSPPPTGVDAVVGARGELATDAAAWRESGMRLAAFLTAVLAYGVQTFHVQQYGLSPFIAAAPLAIAGGLALRDAEREALPWRMVTAGATFLTVIVFRDYALFPKSAIAALGLPDGGPAFPEGFNIPLGDWLRAQGGGALGAMLRGAAPAVVYELLAMVLFILLGLSALYQGAGDVRPFAWNRPFTWLAEFEAGARERVALPRAWWERALDELVANLRVAVAVISVAVFTLCWSLALFVRVFTTPARIALKVIGSLPLIVLAATYAIIALWAVFAVLGAPGRAAARLLGSRVALLAVAAAAVALVMTQLFVPALSEHLSPRGVLAVIRQVRRPGEPVARFGGNQGDRGSSYYADFEPTDLVSEADAVAWLRQTNPRHFMIVGSEVFGSLNRAYRAALPAAERHNVPVIDATNSNLYVAASTLDGHPSRNPLDAIVMTRDTLTNGRLPTEPLATGAPNNDHWHPHTPSPAVFDDAIEYLGWNLDSNGMTYVPVGGSFRVTYHFHVLREVPGNHQVFVHVDGACPRINVDHEPAGGKYPLRNWLAGDYIHDEHRITIPGYCRAGTYTVYIGFFQGDDRMRVNGGDHDRENRVVAARVVVR